MKSFEGKILQDKYIIGQPVNSGNQGMIFKIRDITLGDSQSHFGSHVVKFSPQYELLAFEIKILKKVAKKF